MGIVIDVVDVVDMEVVVYENFLKIGFFVNTLDDSMILLINILVTFMIFMSRLNQTNQMVLQINL